MTKAEIESIGKEIEAKLMSMPKKSRTELIERLGDKFMKDYDEPKLTDKVKELGKKITELDERITCIPVGIYSWCGADIEFDPEPEIVIGDGPELMDRYHENGKYEKYICPIFTDDMTKGTWKSILTLWQQLLEETLLMNGTNRNCDYVESCYTWMMVYDIENEKFITLEEL